MSIWDDVRSALANDDIPAINIDYGMLKLPAPKKRGRPRKERPESTLLEKQASSLMGDQKRPRCLNPHCRVRLRKDQKYVCDYVGCYEQALIAYQAVVDLLKQEELPVEDVPDVSAPEAYTRRVLLDGTTAAKLESSLGGEQKRTQKGNAPRRPKRRIR